MGRCKFDTGALCPPHKDGMSAVKISMRALQREPVPREVLAVTLVV